MLIALLQISWTDIEYSQEELERAVHVFPVHLRVLVACTLFLVCISLIFLFIVFTSRIRKTKREWWKVRLLEIYSPVFNELLFSNMDLSNEGKVKDCFSKKDLIKKESRKILSDALIHMHSNFSGDISKRLETLYRTLGFHEDQLALLHDKQWHMVAKGMRNLALMNIKESCGYVRPFLSHPNEIVRYEARVVLMKLSESDHLSFLDEESSWLSDWDQANIYAMMLRIPDIVVPDFSRWLDSSNPSVVDFSIYMIGRFNQLQSIPRLLNLMENADDHKKILILRAIRACNAGLAEEKIIESYEQEKAEVRSEMLVTLQQIATERSGVFLIGLLRRPADSIQTYIQATKCLLTLGEGGVSAIERIIVTQDQRVATAVRHAMDSRI
ncbi:MAG: HEAT repeat domain-containing protein [Bacteroidota bacterium]